MWEISAVKEAERERNMGRTERGEVWGGGGSQMDIKSQKRMVEGKRAAAEAAKGD